MILLTGLYSSGRVDRDTEMRQSLKINLDNPAIERVYAFKENGFNAIANSEFLSLCTRERERRLELVDLGGLSRRITFKEYFEWANDMPWRSESVICLANADIYFDETLKLVKPAHLENKFLCLSRWKHVPGKDPVLDEQVAGGADAWIFKTPVKVPEKSNFTQGVIACDNRIARLMQLEGYKLDNPSLDVRVIHVHASGYRSYGWDTTLLYDDVISAIPRGHLA